MCDFLRLLYEVHVYLLNSSEVREYRVRVDCGVRMKVVTCFCSWGLNWGFVHTLDTLPCAVFQALNL